jgi:hypothetical protein
MDRAREVAAGAVACLLLTGCNSTEQLCVDGRQYRENGQDGIYIATGRDCVERAILEGQTDER